MADIVGKQIHGFRVQRAETVREIGGKAYELRHEQSGARVLYIQTEDDNKVFSISFRTTPKDSTGVPHICEHSTLCGSRKFPLKEPFVELVKGSLNTFLNAMTFPDKTMYPVASRNDRDFKNLMDVYLDAVFFPAMLKDRQVLMQEGWHYEMADEDSPMSYSGVVYNEMKGVFSSPDAQLERHVMSLLFPQTTYGVESGGDPDVIPTLTFEDFTAFYRTYYHPSNSYIFLYGNMDMEATLAFIDEEYLRHFTYTSTDSAIARQTCPGSIVKTFPYGVASDEKTAGKTLHSLTYVVDDAADPTLGLAFKVLTYVLVTSPAAVLKKALSDAGVGKDITADFQDGLLQPLWSLSINGSEPSAQAKILPIVRQTLTDLVHNGIDRQALEGALNRVEFTLREADFAGRPKGLIYGIRCMDTWLYDKDPLAALRYEESLRILRQGLQTKYYEDILQTYLLQNPYYALVSLVPERGGTEQHDRKQAETLAAYKKTLSAAEIKDIVASTKALKKRQETPDTAAALATIPVLSRRDLAPQAEAVEMHKETVAGVTVVRVPDRTNGITYIDAYFDLHGITAAELPYVYLLSDVLGDMDTRRRTYAELASQIDLYTGGLDVSVAAFSDYQDATAYTPVFKVKVKSLNGNVAQTAALLQEITTASVFTKRERLIELVEELKAGWDMDAFRRGHTLVMHRLLSYVSPVEAFSDGGEFSYYRFLTKLAATIRERADEVAKTLQTLLEKIMTKAALTVAVTGEGAAYEATAQALSSWFGALPQGRRQTALCRFTLQRKNEGIMTGGKVQYVAKGGNFRQHGFAYTGALAVLDTILQYGYLWTKIRVQGGAYGAMTRFCGNGDMVLCSYRDPNLRSSIEAYDALPDYLATFDVSDREMTKYVIGTLSRIDIPLTPSLRGAKAMSRYFTGLTAEAEQRRRDQVLQATVQDIRDLAPLLRAVMADNNLCVMGSEGIIRREKELFTSLLPLTE
ncbi:insulinase family protein [uncultured Megasphaera sp.]|uniref:insulinase family protein n=1 Tax=uncultured Megasphaera sp. TaxID=165188 RepID=UPI0025968288|nr:insulinase family protein [uncultured Megasphaera sp.]